MHISEINIYPIKSLKGISVDSAMVEPRGLQFDRRWILVDANGGFLTQREVPKMATIGVDVRAEGLLASSSQITPMLVPFEPNTGDEMNVTVWGTDTAAIGYGGGVNQWFSQVLGLECKLVYMPDDAGRVINELFNAGDDIVSFADGFPQLLIGEASLENLNERIEQAAMLAAPVQMNRFRPNIVVSGSEAFAEDNWKRISAGNAVFRSTKPCARCVITTINQSKGEFDGKEPLKTLSSYRMAKDVMPQRIAAFGMNETAVLFGQNLIGESIGATINVGDEVVAIESYV